jgi:hypothetical protein
MQGEQERLRESTTVLGGVDVRSRVRAARTTIGRLLPRNNSVEATRPR